MIPLSNVVHSQWTVAPPSLTRYNGFAAVEVVGAQAPGHSSGEAMNAMQQMVDKDLPPASATTGPGSRTRKSCPAARHDADGAFDRGRVPVPGRAVRELVGAGVGVAGGAGGRARRGRAVDAARIAERHLLQIGLITVIGLAAKNAILIVEFRDPERNAGKPLAIAVVEASKLRLRPILMTSMAFIMGVLRPGDFNRRGRQRRHAIGTGVIGGMLFCHVPGLLFIPLFYTVVRRLLGDKLDAPLEGVHRPSTL